MKTSTSLILTTSPLSQPAVKPRRTASLTPRQRLLYGRKRRYSTGKERDYETGLHYYGARYLDGRTGRWISGDPAVGEYVPEAPVNDEARKRNGNLPGQGGVFNYVNLHVYHYAGNNPVKYTDPDGKQNKKVYTFQVESRRFIDGKLFGSTREVYYSTDPERLKTQRQKIRGDLDNEGDMRYSSRIRIGDRYTGSIRGDPPNSVRETVVFDIVETEVTDVSPLEEEVLDAGMIRQVYYIEMNEDGTESARLGYTRSLDEAGRNTDQINELE